MFNDNKPINLQNPTNLERWELMHRSRMHFREWVSEPDEETLAMWAIEDASDKILRKYYERLDAEETARKSADDDDYNISFKSEVKVKK